GMAAPCKAWLAPGGGNPGYRRQMVVLIGRREPVEYPAADLLQAEPTGAVQVVSDQIRIEAVAAGCARQGRTRALAHPALSAEKQVGDAARHPGNRLIGAFAKEACQPQHRFRLDRAGMAYEQYREEAEHDDADEPGDG